MRNKQLQLNELQCSTLDDSVNPFRPIHYLGSKLRIATSIVSAINEVDPYYGRVCDLFSGSGTVSGAFSNSRAVTSVDIQEYSRVLCSAVLRPAQLSPLDIEKFINEAISAETSEALAWSFSPLIEYENTCLRNSFPREYEALAEILEMGALGTISLQNIQERTLQYREATKETLKRLDTAGMRVSPLSTCSRFFGGIYFSFQQAVLLDSLVNHALKFDAEVKDTCMAAVLRVASILVNTVGKQFAQPIKPRTKHGDLKNNFAPKMRKDRELDTIDIFKDSFSKLQSLNPTRFEHKIIAGDYLDVLKREGENFSCVYADPPYTRDHYSRYYHVLETICKRDNPDISTVKQHGKVSVSRGIYRADRHQSPFCIRSKAPEAFNALFEHIHDLGIPLVLSYSPHEKNDGTHPRVVTMGQISELANRVFKSVRIDNVHGITHSKLNSVVHELPSRTDAEVLFICKSR